MFSFLRLLFEGKAVSVPASIYDFKVPALGGGVIDFSEYKGRKILIVNTASKCGKTPQYAGLQALYERYKDRLTIVGFPSNSFLFQEPGSSEQIADFCEINYHITFPMAAKVPVRGRNTAPIYRWLTEKRYNGYADSKMLWNFQKYLIDEHGKLIAVFYPNVLPDNEELIKAVEQ